MADDIDFVITPGTESAFSMPTLLYEFNYGIF